MTTDAPERTLSLESRDFGVLADPDAGFEMWTNTRGDTIVGATWWAKGQGRLYANVLASTVTVRETWPCSQYAGYNTECGADATEFLDGFPFCPDHATTYRVLAEYAVAMDEARCPDCGERRDSIVHADGCGDWQ